MRSEFRSWCGHLFNSTDGFEAELRGRGLAILLVKGDARCLPFEDGGFDKLCVDLPWGESIGTRESNVSLYKDTFEESYRLCRPKGKLVVLTQDRRALKALTNDVERRWQLVEERCFVQRGFHPQCRVYEKRG